MAGDWVPMRHDLHEDPAVIGIGSATGLDADSVVGKLHRLWVWAASHSITGLLPNVSAEWINRKLDQPGFAEAMSANGWLVIRNGAVQFPAFERWLSHGAKARLLDARRKANARSVKETVSGLQPDKSRTKTGLQERREENILSKDPDLEKGEEGGLGETVSGLQPDKSRTKAISSSDVNGSSLTPHALADVWANRLRRGQTKIDAPGNIAMEIDEMIRLGTDAASIRVALLDDKRDRSQTFWKFRAEFFPEPKGGKPREKTKAEIEADCKETQRLHAEQVKRLKGKP